MANETSSVSSTAAAQTEWTSTKVYLLGAISLVLGIALGALFHGPVKAAAPAPSAQQMPAGNPHAGMDAAMQAAANDPAFAKAKSEPNNFDAQAAAGSAAMKSGNPTMAADYYGRALKIKDDVDVRINLANADFRSGDSDQALKELDTVLKADPKNDKALYNTGVVRLMGKNDPKGALAAWDAFLKYHPDHPHKDKVQEMIKRVRASMTQG